MVGYRKPQQMAFDALVVATPATRARELLRAINNLVDFEFVREVVEPYFARGGRPTVDPVLMLTMMLLGYLFDIESDRRRTEQEALHLRPGPRPLHLSGAQAAQVEPLSRAATRALLHGQSQRLQRLPAQVAVHHGAAAQRISVGAAICT